MDQQKLLPLCVAIQRYYKSINAKTKVLPASLTSTEEIFSLAGVNHLTIAPKLLAQLAQPMSGTFQSLFDADAAAEPVPAPGVAYSKDAGKYKITFARDKEGASQRKLTEVCSCLGLQGEDISADMQRPLTSSATSRINWSSS